VKRFFFNEETCFGEQKKKFSRMQGCTPSLLLDISRRINHDQRISYFDQKTSDTKKIRNPGRERGKQTNMDK
jgi:hypothetical protein